MNDKIKLDSGNIKSMLQRQKNRSKISDGAVDEIIATTDIKAVSDNLSVQTHEVQPVLDNTKENSVSLDNVEAKNIKKMDASGIKNIVRNESVQEAIAEAIKTEEDILLNPVGDRRILPNVPDKSRTRTNIDRRGIVYKDEIVNDYDKSKEKEETGKRYIVDYPIKMRIRSAQGNHITIDAVGKNISSSGLLCQVDEQYRDLLETASLIELSFEIKPGTMPEGYEMKVKKIKAKWVRSIEGDEPGTVKCGFQFVELLAQYVYRKRQRYMLSVASFGLFLVTLFIIFLRAENIIYLSSLYFTHNKILYLYSIFVALFLLSRYLFGAFYKPTPINPEYTPSVSIVIPCFNEERWIKRTITSCLNQDYPLEKLEVIVIDDCSNDNSQEKIKEILQELKKEVNYDAESRVHFYAQPKNAGKREALVVGAKMAKNELLVFVDSDSFLDPFAIRNLVQPFQDKKVGGVSGRTDVANTFTNNLTKMQSVRYYIAFRILKAAEGLFDAVTCLSGPLSCYRKDLVLKYSDAWLNQTFLGQKATFGDDRAMTNFILRHHRTDYQDTAVCSTIVPKTYKVFLKQQMRWKRSWLRESFIAATFMWRKEPFMALSFYMGLLVPIVSPIIVIYNLIYIPLAHRVFPLTFIIGMMMMALLMSFAQLFLRRSSTWFYGVWFCLYYEAVLLWQMPVAWFTFWKSTWGTRMTTADLAELLKGKNKLRQKEGDGL